MVAIKTMKCTSKQVDSLSHTIIREVDVLKNLNGTPGVIQLLQIYRETIISVKGGANQVKFKLIFPCFEDGDLMKHMQ